MIHFHWVTSQGPSHQWKLLSRCPSFDQLLAQWCSLFQVWACFTHCSEALCPSSLRHFPVLFLWQFPTLCVFLLFLKNFFLEYSCFIIFCLYSEVNQSVLYIYVSFSASQISSSAVCLDSTYKQYYMYCLFSEMPNAWILFWSLLPTSHLLNFLPPISLSWCFQIMQGYLSSRTICLFT